jgi:phosphosulfolactate phosphohydrolase-like enzyme
VRRRQKNKLTSGQRFMVGALFAAAFFFVEAGVAEILLANNARCEAMVSGMRLRFGLEDICTADWVVYMLSALS